MAHAEQLAFVTAAFSEIETALQLDNYTVLEIGSFDVNGNIRGVFKNSSTYTGVDLVDGKNVDLTYDGQNLSLGQTYDICVCCEVFEHDKNWKNTFRNMIKHCHSGSAVIVTCATSGRVEHGTSRTSPEQSPGTQHMDSSYYKNVTKEDFIENFNLEEIFETYFFKTYKKSNDLYFIGFIGINNPDIEQQILQNFHANLRLAKKFQRQNNGNIFRIAIKMIINADLPIRFLLLRFNSEFIYQEYMVKKRTFLNNIKLFLRMNR